MQRQLRTSFKQVTSFLQRASLPKELEALKHALGLGPKSANLIPQRVQPHLLFLLLKLLLVRVFQSILPMGCVSCCSARLIERDALGYSLEKPVLDIGALKHCSVSSCVTYFGIDALEGWHGL